MRLAAAVGFVAALASVAHANGRSPATNGVYFAPADNDSVYVRSTFGLLISHDDGCTFRWVCEQNIGYGGMFDPKYEIAADGTVFATTFGGLRVSRDGGCSFTTATAELPAGDPGRIANLWVDAIDIGPTGDVWVATAESGQPNDVYRSTDNGITFTKAGLSSATVWWKSLAVAPSDAMQIYVTGYQVANPAPAAHLFTTADGGAAWTEITLTDVAFAPTPIVMVAAVDPTDPQILFLRSVGANNTGDRLYRSADAGVTFTEVLATDLPIADVVIRDTAVHVVAGAGGVFRSDDRGVTFAPVAGSPQLGCLAKRSDGTLVGCAPNWDPDFMAVGRSSDAAQWQKIFRFVELAGPVTCPAGTVGRDVCDQQMWPALQTQFGATGPSCGGDTDLAGDTDPGDGGGCCDAGERAPFGVSMLGFIVAWVLARRPRRRQA
ncbi:MAG: exo-alpha-sialidase [Deltaproteobacteria bacterium]|nr:exo-alpha-sialidase [Deltaproteobacteria bacterium]MDQ3299324.1 glycoside hydrolase [Myxococcota bacterium]